MKYISLTIGIVIIAIASFYLGIGVGKEKMWAHVNALEASGAHLNLVAPYKYPELEDFLTAKNASLKNDINQAVEVYGRYTTTFAYLVPDFSITNAGIERSMQRPLDWYSTESNGELIDVNGSEAWEIVTSRDPEFYADIKQNDPDQYQEFKAETLKWHSYLQAAYKNK